MSTPTRDLSRLTLGTAPDSWGVWFAKDDKQVGLEAVPRRSRERRVHLDRTRAAGIPAAGPAPAPRRTGLPWPEGQRWNSFRRTAQGQGGAG